MSLRDDLTAEVEEIFRARWTTREGQVVPEDDDVQLGNDGVKLNATILYADLADSTHLVDGHQDYFAAEVYKAFLVCAARIVKAESGVITAYDGDRIMAVYIGGSKNTAAVRTAMKIRYAVDEIVNAARRNQYPKNEYSVRHVIGIDTSDVFVARTGVRGANDLVWVGRAANYAAKLAALPETRSTYITEEVFNAMHDDVKFATNATRESMWTRLKWNTFDDRILSSAERIMAKGWTDKSEFDLLKGELAATSDRGFERAIVPFLQISHPGLVTPPARKGFDRSGVDHLVWSDTPPHTLVVQCKGFEVREWELGKPQADQCIESIISFRDSGLKTKSYLLVHNRAGKQENFRPPVVAALRSLVRAGVAEHAELWDLGKLLKNSFESMFQQIRTLAHEQNVSAVRGYEAAEPELCEPLREVPLLVSTVVADQYRATGTSEQYEKAADPVEILRRVKTRFSLLVGYAGFGKTTATLRMTREGGQKTIYVPAAVFTDGINGTKEILERCIDIEPLISRAEPADQAILRKVARPAIEHFFKMDDGSFTLLLDGIDESTLFGRRGGLQHLFNSLRPVKSRVVMTVRKEYLDARMADFESSFGIVSDNQHKVRHQRITKVELLEWDDRRILALVKRYGGVLEGDAAKRITDLASAVASGEYQAFYGDIPRRPLFLRFILETVKEKGVHKVSRSSLFEEWAVLKIKRDVVRPAQAGGQRQPIASENSIDDTVELAFDVMG